MKPDFDFAAWRRERSASSFCVSGERSLRGRDAEWIARILPVGKISELDRECNECLGRITGFPSFLSFLRKNKIVSFFYKTNLKKIIEDLSSIVHKNYCY